MVYRCLFRVNKFPIPQELEEDSEHDFGHLTKEYEQLLFEKPQF